MRLLLVEDNELHRDMISRRLERRGFEVDVVEDGREALAYIDAGDELPDLVIMDLSLPNLDGWEVTRRLKRDEEYRDIPVIALTAHSLAGDRESALEAGCDAFETKPLVIERLIEKIGELTNSS